MLLPDDEAHRIYEAFQQGRDHFSVRNSFRERKQTSSQFDLLPPLLRDVTFAFQTPEVVSLLSELLNIDDLSGDPTLYAGGLSKMGKGDFLNPHIDNSHEATRDRYRRVNLLYYVTPDWNLEDGGNLELWDPHVRKPVTIYSAFNRLVLMETNRGSWHSVSRVTTSKASRCCVSNYYFSEISPNGGDYYHVTSFTGRPGQLGRRLVAHFDNRARDLARKFGASRASDKGYQGN